MTASASDEDELRELEQERCRAIGDHDLARLAELLHDELRHVHVTGTAQDKTAVLAGLADRPRQTSRESLTVRVLGDVATMTGVQRNTRPGRATDRLQVLQVWVRAGGGWQLLEFCASGPIAANG